MRRRLVDVRRLSRRSLSSHSLVSIRVVSDRDLRCRVLSGRTRVRSQICAMPVVVAAANTLTSGTIDGE